MGEPSKYELNAWREVESYKPRPISAFIQDSGAKVAEVAETIAKNSREFAEKTPVLSRVASGSSRVVKSATKNVATFAGKAVGLVPKGAVDWTGAAVGSVVDSLSKLSRAGLSPKRVVQLHKKRGHAIKHFHDLRELDLQQIDAVGRRGSDWVYHLVVAGSGAGAGLVISGSELAVTSTAGVSAAPSAAVIASAMAGDAALVLAMSTRAVAHAAVLYGYDPNIPSEKIFIFSIIRAGSVISAGAKTAAFKDISKLTQALVRNKSWAILQESIVANVAKKFADQFTVKLTKDGLGKMVPGVGLVVGAAFNVATIDSIVDAANHAYRKRFLLEKYPHLAGQASEQVDEVIVDAEIVEGDEAAETPSVIALIREAGGPDF